MHRAPLPRYSHAPPLSLSHAGGLFTVTCKHWEPPEYTEAQDPETAGDFEQHYVEPSPGTVMGGDATTETYSAHFIVNAAGCASDKVAAMVGDTAWHVKPRLGEYILLDKTQGHMARHVLFPCPHPVYGKGVLVQSTLWGNLILGPTARDTMLKNQNTGEYEKDPAVLAEDKDSILGYLLSKCRKLVPSFDPGRVIHSFAGTRAKNTTGDWIIGPVSDVPGFINAASIDSPGIAASPAIAIDVRACPLSKWTHTVAMRIAPPLRHHLASAFRHLLSAGRVAVRTRIAPHCADCGIPSRSRCTGG